MSKQTGAAVGGVALVAVVALLAFVLLDGGDADDPGPRPAVQATSAGRTRPPTPAVDVETAGRPAPSAEPGPASGPAEPDGVSTPGSDPGQARGLLSCTVADDRGEPVLYPELVLSREERTTLVETNALDRPAAGGFRAEVPAGAWTLVVRAADHLPSPAREVVVPAGGEAPAQRVVLTRAGVLRGTVEMSDEWARRLPLTFKLVLVVSDDEPRTVESDLEEDDPVLQREELWVGIDRTFELRDRLPGRYRLRLELPGPGGGVIGPWVQTWLDPGDVRGELKLPFSDAVPVSVRGRVVDDLGRPIAGAEVALEAVTVHTDAQGRFELRGVEVGPHELQVSAPGHGPTARAFDHLGKEQELDTIQLLPVRGPR